MRASRLSGTPHQQVAQLARVPAADAELARRRPATVQRPASIRTSSTCARLTSSERWMRTKPASAQPSSSVVSGVRSRWLSAADVQPGVVALRLDPADVAAADEPGHAAELDGHLLVVARAVRPVAARDHAPHGLGEPFLAHRLEHVVDARRARRRRPRARRARSRTRPAAATLKLAQHAGPARGPDSPGIRMSRKTASTSVSRSSRSASVAESQVRTRADPVVAAEQELQLVERRLLVVDHEQAQGIQAVMSAQWTPGAYFGHPHGHLGARVRGGLHDQAVVVTERPSAAARRRCPGRPSRCRGRRPARVVPAPGPRPRRRPRP